MNLKHALASGRQLILDGGTGSELRRRDIELSGTAWSAAANLTHSTTLQQIHRDYIEAGADIVTANTFATSRFVLAGAGLERDFANINIAAIKAAQAAAAEAGIGTWIAGSLSCLPPRFDAGQYPRSEREYRDYAELAECFATLAVDLVLIEMLQHPAHAALACRAVAAAGLPFCAGISVRPDSARSGTESRPALVAFNDASVSIDDLLEAILPHAPDAVAVMHSPLAAMAPALHRVREVWTGPVAAYAEIAYPEDPAYQGQARIPPAAYADEARTWLELGAHVIGGCCGTTPEHIAALGRLPGRAPWA